MFIYLAFVEVLYTFCLGVERGEDARNPPAPVWSSTLNDTVVSVMLDFVFSCTLGWANTLSSEAPPSKPRGSEPHLVVKRQPHFYAANIFGSKTGAYQVIDNNCTPQRQT